VALGDRTNRIVGSLWRHKWRWIIPLALLTIIGVTVAVLGFAWLPSYRAALKHGERFGVDVSDHQGQINWAKVARSDVSFVYLKATEGSTYVDHDFAGNLAAARSAGLPVGAYHFFTLCSPGGSQAANFLKAEPPGSTTLPSAVDLELPGNCSARPGLNVVKAQLSAFVKLVQQATDRPVVYYIGDSFQHQYPIPQAETGLRWKRRILRRPSPPWVIWQVDGLAHVGGIRGGVDLDVMNTATFPEPEGALGGQS
jgi:lysozyme